MREALMRTCAAALHAPTCRLYRPRPPPWPQSVPRTVFAAVESDIVKPIAGWLAAYENAKVCNTVLLALLVGGVS